MTRRQTRRKNFFLFLNIFIPPDDEECGKWIAIWRRRKSLNFFPFLGKKSSADFKRTIFSLGKRAAAPPIDYKPKSMSQGKVLFFGWERLTINITAPTAGGRGEGHITSNGGGEKAPPPPTIHQFKEAMAPLPLHRAPRVTTTMTPPWHVPF